MWTDNHYNFHNLHQSVKASYYKQLLDQTIKTLKLAYQDTLYRIIRNALFHKRLKQNNEVSNRNFSSITHQNKSFKSFRTFQK